MKMASSMAAISTTGSAKDLNTTAIIKNTTTIEAIFTIWKSLSDISVKSSVSTASPVK